MSRRKFVADFQMSHILELLAWSLFTIRCSCLWKFEGWQYCHRWCAVPCVQTKNVYRFVKIQTLLNTFEQVRSTVSHFWEVGDGFPLFLRVNPKTQISAHGGKRAHLIVKRLLDLPNWLSLTSCFCAKEEEEGNKGTRGLLSYYSVVC